MEKYIFDELNSSIFSAIMGNPAAAFPEFSFTRKGNYYYSNCNAEGQPTKKKERTILKLYNGVAMVFCNDQDEEKTNVISFFAKTERIQYGEALKKLCAIYSIPFPENNSPEYAAYLQDQETKQQIFKLCRKALFEPEGRAVYEYLLSRKYTDEYIRDVEEFGALTPAIISKYGNVKFWAKPQKETKGPMLIIPIYSNNAIQAFKTRLLNPIEGESKYINTIGYKRNLNPFLLSGYKRQSENEGAVIIVEGELDALNARHKGFNNVIAVAGGNISEELAKRLRELGIYRATIVLDHEKDAQSRKQTALKAIKNISILDNQYITALIAEFPGAEAGKMDTDLFLCTHASEDFKTILNNAVNGAIYQCREIAQKYIKDNEITHTDFIDLTQEIEALCKKQRNKYNVDLICDEAEIITNGHIKSATIKNGLSGIQKEQFLLNVAETAKKANSFIDKGKFVEAGAILAKQAEELNKNASFEEYAKLAAAPQYKTFIDSLKEEELGEKTGFYFGGHSAEDELILPAGGLTFVCGLPGHGKSRFMQNLAINAAREAIMKAEEKETYYITLEESEKAIFKEMANIYANIELSANNLRTIASSYKYGNAFVKNENREQFISYKRREGDFLQQYICSGKLHIISIDYGINDIKGFINYLITEKAPKIIFIDYMQLINKENCTKARHEELKDICKELNDLAKLSGIPFVIGSQFNRQTYSPLEWNAQNISEASDVEKIANTIIALWHSKSKPLIGSQYYRNENEFEILESNFGFKFGEYGKIYAELLKNRFGRKNICASLNWNENTGKIEPGNFEINEREQDENGPQLFTPFFASTPEENDDDLPI